MSARQKWQNTNYLVAVGLAMSGWLYLFVWLGNLLF